MRRPENPVGPLTTARYLLQHSLALVFPSVVWVFLATGPRSWNEAVPWIGVFLVYVLLDLHARPSRADPEPVGHLWPFDLILYAQVALQVSLLVLLGAQIAEHGFFRVETAVGILLVGLNSGHSAIVTAHELIHRRPKHQKLLGRLLLATVFYEHFYTEHIRGHHVHVGTERDPATARFGETYGQFWRRTVPGQLRSAWRLETRRLGDVDMPLTDPRLLRSRVVRGLLAQSLLVVAYTVAFGWGALAAFALQAFIAIHLLEAVNYMEHWGLRRRGKRASTVDSWDAESWLTRFGLVGLTRHADHHAHPARPYPDLRHVPESPKMPFGYGAMVLMVFFDNATLRRMLTDELKRKRLGPFAEEGSQAAK